MAKHCSILQSQYLFAVLCICLACTAIHVMIDSAGGFGLMRSSPKGSRLFEVASYSHAHDDEFLLPALTLGGSPALWVIWLVNPDWKDPSQLADPPHPPPRSL